MVTQPHVQWTVKGWPVSVKNLVLLGACEVAEGTRRGWHLALLFPHVVGRHLAHPGRAVAPCGPTSIVVNLLRQEFTCALAERGLRGAAI